MDKVKAETINGTKWQLVQKCTMQPVQLIFSIILARLVSPEEFGILGLTAIFFGIAMQLQNCGFASTLIRDIHRTDRDINTVFWTNAALSLLLSGLLCLAAPWFADYFHQPALVWLTRASALMMFLNNLANIHHTLYQCERNFKIPAIISLIATFVPMPFTIWVAYLGWGCWALMTLTIINGCVSLVLYWIISPWKPRLIWDWGSFKRYFAFGSRLMLGSITLSILENFRTFLIGKMYNPATLGLFNRAFHLAYLPNQTLNSVLGSVTYSILSSVQEKEERFVQVYSTFMRVSSLGLCFCSILFIALAEPAIAVLYGEQWVSCAPYAQILTWTCITYHIAGLNERVLMVKGRADWHLRMAWLKQGSHFALMIPAAFVSITLLCYASLVIMPPCLYLHMLFTRRLTGMSIMRQMRDFVPYMLMCGLSCLPAYALTWTAIAPIWQLIGGTLSASCIYLLLLHFTQDTAYRKLLHTVRESPYYPKRFRLSQE